MAHKFVVGQSVDFNFTRPILRQAAAGEYEIRRLMPAPDDDPGNPCYRIKSIAKIMSVRFMKARFRYRGGSIPSSPDSDKLEMELKMQNLTPRHINEQESDNRSIKEGWYAMRRNGSLRLGPFLSRGQCVVEISQAQDEPARPSHWPKAH